MSFDAVVLADGDLIMVDIGLVDMVQEVEDVLLLC